MHVCDLYVLLSTLFILSLSHEYRVINISYLNLQLIDFNGTALEILVSDLKHLIINLIHVIYVNRQLF